MTESFAESEYSPEAEALYAEFVAAGDRGDAAFAELCARHPAWADELEGLHSDFASVAGVLARMPVPNETSSAGTEGPAGEEASDEKASALPEPAEPEAPVEKTEPTSRQEPSLPQGAQPARASRSLALVLGLLVVAGIGGGLWLMQRAAAERERLESELQETQTALAEENQRAEEAGREARQASREARQAQERAEREAADREQAERTAGELRQQAQQAELRSEQAAAAAELASRWARVQSQLERGDLAAARATLAATNGSTWEQRHLERRLATLEAAAAGGRRLVEATFFMMAADRWASDLAQAVSAGVREAGLVAPHGERALDLGQPAEEVTGDWDETRRRFAVSGGQVRVLDPDLGVPLLVVDVPESVRGLSFEDGELWLHFASDPPEILP